MLTLHSCAFYTRDQSPSRSKRQSVVPRRTLFTQCVRRQLYGWLLFTHLQPAVFRFKAPTNTLLCTFICHSGVRHCGLHPIKQPKLVLWFILGPLRTPKKFGSQNKGNYNISPIRCNVPSWGERFDFYRATSCLRGVCHRRVSVCLSLTLRRLNTGRWRWTPSNSSFPTLKISMIFERGHLNHNGGVKCR